MIQINNLQGVDVAAPQNGIGLPSSTKALLGSFSNCAQYLIFTIHYFAFRATLITNFLLIRNYISKSYSFLFKMSSHISLFEIVLCN